jgi:small subunit ribosomal protein S3
VWICKGEVYGKRDLSPNVGMSASSAGKSGGGAQGRKPVGKRKKK